ncbi:MAG: restriction endonuclease [Halobacteria archaeon]
MTQAWVGEVEKISAEYNIPLEDLPLILGDPKVLPMIRGKALEHNAARILRNILPSEIWEVNKLFLNPQLGAHDIDIEIIHKPTKKFIRVECKLAKKEGFRSYSYKSYVEIEVKCMRSRTLGDKKVKELAPKWGVSENQLKIHNDQYLGTEFDFILTSIGNAFYRTEESSGKYIWDPTPEEEVFLQELLGVDKQQLRDVAYRRMYIARVKDVIVSKSNDVKCSRKKCENPDNCGFIPNYPIIKFDKLTKQPVNGWVPIERCVDLFNEFVNG